MILNYAEASSYAKAIAVYFMAMGMSMIIFIWAWRNLVSYFKWVFEPEHDEQLEVLEEIHDSIDDLRSAVEQGQQVDLEIVS